MNPLDPLHLPLRQRQIIEASAGTGKTWTLAALYLRLVIGHGRFKGGQKMGGFNRREGRQAKGGGPGGQQRVFSHAAKIGAAGRRRRGPLAIFRRPGFG